MPEREQGGGLGQRGRFWVSMRHISSESAAESLELFSKNLEVVLRSQHFCLGETYECLGSLYL